MVMISELVIMTYVTGYYKNVCDVMQLSWPQEIDNIHEVLKLALGTVLTIVIRICL